MNESVSRAGRTPANRGRIRATLVCAAAVMLALASPGRLCALTAGAPVGSGAAAAGLPDAPRPVRARVLGTVKNPGGGPLVDVVVTLSGTNPSLQRTVRTDPQGEFVFRRLAAGAYTVSLSGPTIEPGTSQQVVLGAGEVYRLPMTAIPIPKVVSTVRVTADTAAVAKAQVKQQEKQRVLAIIPNFSTSFVWNAAPMTPKLKFRLAARATFDPFTIFTDAALAGIEQSHDTFPGYGTGWQGYGKRFGATLADSFDARMIGDAALPSLFHQDPRYFYHGGPHTMRRLMYVMQETVMCRGDDGKQQVCYSHLLGAFSAAGIGNVYHAPGDRGFGITMRDGLVILAGDAAENVMREFVSKALTSHLPRGPKGKKAAQQR